MEVRTGWFSQNGTTKDWARREGFKPGDEAGLAYDATVGSLRVYKGGRLLGTVVAAGGLPIGGGLVWAVAMMGRAPGYDEEGQEVRVEAWELGAALNECEDCGGEMCDDCRASTDYMYQVCVT